MLRLTRLICLLIPLSAGFFPPSTPLEAITSTAEPTIHFAVIGDFGFSANPDRDSRGRPPVEAVADLVKSWDPDFIITVGDNNYPVGAANKMDENIGNYYRDYITSDPRTNRFFPSLGNHDWGKRCRNPRGADPYLAYFTLPGNERYYTITRGPVQLFALNSDCNESDSEPDDSEGGSTQRTWLRRELRASNAKWKLLYFHHPTFSSGVDHGSSPWMQWPFQDWGATAVLTGHDHDYERIVKRDFPYFVNGLGGRNRKGFRPCIPGSRVRYNRDYGAMRVTATVENIKFEFISRGNRVIDTYTITEGGATEESSFLAPCSAAPRRGRHR